MWGINISLKFTRFTGSGEAIRNLLLEQCNNLTFLSFIDFIKILLCKCGFKVVAIRRREKDHTFPQNFWLIGLILYLSKIVDIVIRHGLNRNFSSSTSFNKNNLDFARTVSCSGWQTLLGTQLKTAKFYTVGHRGFIHKMISSGIDSNIVHSYISGRTFSVIHEAEVSSGKDLAAGVP